MRYKQTCVYGVIAGRCIRGIELYRWQETYFMNHGGEKKPQFESCMAVMAALISSKVWFFNIHCPHSSGGCWFPNNGFVGIMICGLSLERL